MYFHRVLKHLQLSYVQRDLFGYMGISGKEDPNNKHKKTPPRQLSSTILGIKQPKEPLRTIRNTDDYR